MFQGKGQAEVQDTRREFCGCWGYELKILCPDTKSFTEGILQNKAHKYCPNILIIVTNFLVGC